MGASSGPELRASRVDVVHVELERGDGDVARARERLTDAERARAERFRRPRDARAWTLAHGALRSLVGTLLARAPEELVFERGAHDKPYLADGALEFNLSHAGRWALIALATAPVGVDVERLGRFEASPGIARHAFGDRERARLADVSESEWDRVATRLWVRKEAILKAIGAGFAGGLTSVDVGASLDGPARIELRVDGADWAIADLPVDEAHVGAVAHRPDVTDVRAWTWDPVEERAVR